MKKTYNIGIITRICGHKELAGNNGIVKTIIAYEPTVLKHEQEKLCQECSKKEKAQLIKKQNELLRKANEYCTHHGIRPEDCNISILCNCAEIIITIK